MFYVYVIFRPCGTPCYVGKGTGNRYRVHFRKSSNPHLARIIAKYGELPVVIARSGMTESEAFETEVALISAIGRAPHSGPLVNLTIGGEGGSGSKRTPESLARMSAAQRGKKMPAAWLAAQIGKVISENQRAKIAASLTGKTQTSESNAKRSATMRGRKKPPMSDAQKAAISATLIGNVPWNVGVPMSDAQRKSLAAIHLGSKASEETRAKMRASQTLAWERRRAA